MTNYEKLMNDIKIQHKPFIVSDVETTGIMDGNDNRITQIALAGYKYENGRYQLQDKIFMLAGADKKVLDEIESRQSPDRENVEKLLAEDYAYNIKADLLRKIKNCTNRLKTATNKYNSEKIRIEQNKLETLQDAYDTVVDDMETHPEKYTIANAKCREYVNEHFAEKQKALEDNIRNGTNLDGILKLQGIDKEKWLSTDNGLTIGELQIGINEFMKKYKTPETILLTNGSYYQKHYMDKAGLTFGDIDVIDLNQVDRSVTGLGGEWTTDTAKFSENYRNRTGKTIHTFDALTKSLIYAEMATDICGLDLQNTSKDYLENMVKETAFNHDDDYVMSLSAMAKHDWILTDHVPVNFNGYIFHSLEYVNFGNDKRYVDLDTMFRVNENFEITLEGQKEPIKTWEELEAKIKALNAHISEELLKKIEDRYREISAEAKFEKMMLEKSTVKSEAYQYYEDNEKADEYEDDKPYIDEEYEEDWEVSENTIISEPTREEKFLTKLTEMSKRMEELYTEQTSLKTREAELNARKKELFREKITPLAEAMCKLEETGKYGTLDGIIQISYARTVDYHVKAEVITGGGYGVRIVSDADYSARILIGDNPYSITYETKDRDNLSDILEEHNFGGNVTVEILYSKIAEAFVETIEKAVSNMEHNNSKKTEYIQALEKELEEEYER